MFSPAFFTLHIQSLANISNEMLKPEPVNCTTVMTSSLIKCIITTLSEKTLVGI